MSGRQPWAMWPALPWTDLVRDWDEIAKVMVQSSQLITTRAGVEVDESSLNGKVCVKSPTGPLGGSILDSASSFWR